MEGVSHQQIELGSIVTEQPTLCHKKSCFSITLAPLWFFIFRNMSECHIVSYHFFMTRQIHVKLHQPQRVKQFRTELLGISLLGNSYPSQGHHLILFPTGNQILTKTWLELVLRIFRYAIRSLRGGLLLSCLISSSVCCNEWKNIHIVLGDEPRGWVLRSNFLSGLVWGSRIVV